jgi:glycosyltransferase involved in cell wall biosynthesis
VRFLVDAHHLGLRKTGNETWTRNVVAALAGAAGNDVLEYAVTATGAGELQRLTTARAYHVSAHSTRRLVLDLPLLARRTRCDAMLVTYTVPLTARPCVVLVHDLSFYEPASSDWFPPLTLARHRLSNRLSCRRATRLLAPSELTRRQIVDRWDVPPERISVATDAVDPDLRALITIARPRPSDGVFTVLAVGDVVPRKNLVLLARAVARCIHSGARFQLRLVGQVPSAGQPIVQEIRDALGPALRLPGYVSRAELAAEYRSADVLCFPSLFEGFGIPVIEAMTAGTPVMVSDAGCLPETAGGAAMVLPARDVEAWHQALMGLSRNVGLQHRLRRLGSVRANEFSWDQSARAVIAALRAAGSA